MVSHLISLLLTCFASKPLVALASSCKQPTLTNFSKFIWWHWLTKALKAGNDQLPDPKGIGAMGGGEQSVVHPIQRFVEAVTQPDWFQQIYWSGIKENQGFGLKSCTSWLTLMDLCLRLLTASLARVFGCNSGPMSLAVICLWITNWNLDMQLQKAKILARVHFLPQNKSHKKRIKCLKLLINA